MGHARRTRKSIHHHRPDMHPNDQRCPELPSVSMADTDVPPCPDCGPGFDLTSGWLSGDLDLQDCPLTLFCKRCGRPVALMS